MANVVFLLSVFTSISVSMCQDMISSKFSKEHVICDVADRVDRGCSTEIHQSRSRIHCSSLCGSDKSCIGASLDTNGVCFHHKECPTISGGCTIQNNDHIYMTKYCAHGSWDNPSQSCKCVDGFFGDRCKQCPKHCKDLLSMGYEPGNRRVYIDPDHDGQKPFLVTCYINPITNYTAVTIIRNRGKKDFNKTWLDYVHGFYYDQDHLWGGLYPWYRLSLAGLNDVVFMFEFFSYNYNPIPAVYRHYKNMSVSNESTGFRFTTKTNTSATRGVVPSGSEFGDCLGPLQNVKFSTWDSDNDDSQEQNCAAITGSGWWYIGCDNHCNVLGYGLQYSGTKPRNQIMSLVGVDTDSMAMGDLRFNTYLPNN